MGIIRDIASVMFPAAAPAIQRGAKKRGSSPSGDSSSSGGVTGASDVPDKTDPYAPDPTRSLKRTGNKSSGRDY